MDRGGKLIVFSAPSGSGKTTIVRHLLKQEVLNLAFFHLGHLREPVTMRKMVPIIISCP